jgi:DNA repair exonuclease SbcCD ATPase subunit
MTTKLEELLENDVLGPEVKTALQEAFDAKIKQSEAKLQEDYAARYANDKHQLVEAMDNMLNDTIRSELEEFAEDRAALIAQKTKLSKETLAAKRIAEAKVAQHTKLLNAFISKQLKEEVSEFVSDRKTLESQRRKMAKEVEAIRESAKKSTQNRISKLEGFVVKKLSEEIAEFETDKKALIEQRAKLAAEGKKKINETKAAFVQKATSTLDKTLNEVIRNELVQWRDDIKVARENNFGRRIFEAVASEYMASYLSEGSQVKKLQRQLAESQSRIVEAKKQINEKQKLVESAAAQIKKANDRVQRNDIMKEMLAPLARDKKAIMEEMLQDIKTSNLKEAFNRYLPTVMNGEATGAIRQKLSENATKNSVAFTGDRPNKLSEAVRDEGSNDMNKILYLAGINK